MNDRNDMLILMNDMLGLGEKEKSHTYYFPENLFFTAIDKNTRFYRLKGNKEYCFQI